MLVEGELRTIRGAGPGQIAEGFHGSPALFGAPIRFASGTGSRVP